MGQPASAMEAGVFWPLIIVVDRRLKSESRNNLVEETSIRSYH